MEEYLSSSINSLGKPLQAGLENMTAASNPPAFAGIHERQLGGMLMCCTARVCWLAILSELVISGCKEAPNPNFDLGIDSGLKLRLDTALYLILDPLSLTCEQYWYCMS